MVTTSGEVKSALVAHRSSDMLVKVRPVQPFHTSPPTDDLPGVNAALTSSNQFRSHCVPVVDIGWTYGFSTANGTITMPMSPMVPSAAGDEEQVAPRSN